MENIRTIEQVVAALSDLGFKTEIETETTISTGVGGDNHPFKVILRVGEEDITIVCEIMKRGDISPLLERDFWAACADMNSRILPYSVCLLSDKDDESFGQQDQAEWPVCLIDSIPLGDLSIDEIGVAMEKILPAIISLKPLITEVTNKTNRLGKRGQNLKRVRIDGGEPIDIDMGMSLGDAIMVGIIAMDMMDGDLDGMIGEIPAEELPGYNETIDPEDTVAAGIHQSAVEEHSGGMIDDGAIGAGQGGLIDDTPDKMGGGNPIGDGATSHGGGNDSDGGYDDGGSDSGGD